ncbi:S-layer homology domain-containing protein [uncultured Dysosmobacter sp.]|uniref:S-layer homology domain-containing protein n=1 Tax=uncultured Dysosmobacter sp. TaxID=2591384 RepID=UPI00262DA49B|nr:S-layer homology domain-containing protein [uncultured Dysosmobacter sp.]
MKKFLSLVLALVMVMSLVTIGAGAKDFTDDSKINYEEAVDVMSALKVIDGYPDGSFAPQGSLTRGAAAKIICNLILGPTTASALSADTAPYKDVPVNHTFAGYIAYCQEQGIISGYADGSFRPAATLTNYAFLKMLLGALGYNAEIEGYVGDNWSIAVAKQALHIGLTKGLEGDLNGTEYATREQACLYALNTLKATMVDYEAKITANVNGAQVIVGNSVANDVKWNISKNTDGHIKDDGYVQFAEKYFEKLELEIGNGMYGRPANTWKLKKSEIGTYTSIDPTLVYTEGTKNKDVYKDLSKDVIEDYDWTAFVNGKEVDEAVTPVKNGSKEYIYTGEGTVTEIYVNDDDESVTVVEINYYLGQVSKVKTDDDGEYITVKELSKGSKLDDKTFYVEDYAEDDYVVFTVDYDEEDEDYVIGEVCEPEVVTAEVTRVENDKEEVSTENGGVHGNTYLKADGSKYTYTDGANSCKTDVQDHMVYDVEDPTEPEHPELNEEYVLYLDPNGYVLGFEKAEADASKYLWVKDSDEELRDWIAKVVLDDATSAKVEVKDEVVGLDENNDDEDDEIKWTVNKDTDGKNMTNIDEHIWKYTVNDKGVYTLKNVETLFLPHGDEETDRKADFDPDADGVKVNNGRAYITSDGTTFIVDNKTIFVDVENEKAYVGYKNVPNVDHAELAYVLDKDGKKADVVFILQGDVYDKDSTYFVLEKTDRESLKYDGDKYWEYTKAYVNGEKTSVYVSYDAANKTVLKTGVVYKATKTVDEQYIIELKAVTDKKFVANEVGLDAFWLLDEDADPVKTVQYDTNEETVFVVVEQTKDNKWKIYDGDIKDILDEDDLDDPDCDYSACLVQVLENDEETAELVYIYLTEKGSDKVEITEGDGTIDVTVQKGDKDGDKTVVTLENPLYEGGDASGWNTVDAVVTIEMTVDGETYSEVTKFEGSHTLSDVLSGANTPKVGVAPTGTHKLVVSATVKFDGSFNDAYTFVGESNVLYW